MMEGEDGNHVLYDGSSFATLFGQLQMTRKEVMVLEHDPRPHHVPAALARRRCRSDVIPAQAGTQGVGERAARFSMPWVPACAGMTGRAGILHRDLTSHCQGLDNVPTVPASTQAELLQRMNANPWFAGLPLADRRALLAASDRVRLAPGEMLFRQGDEVPVGSGAFFGVVSGGIKASSLREDGKEAILVVLEAGNWFGEISLIDGRSRTHDATAVGEAQLLALPGPAFARMMQRPPFALAICRMLAARVRSLYGMVEDATLRSTRARVARRLLLLARGDATQARDARPVVPVSQEALAMMLGVSRQTLSKELQDLARQGAVELGYGRVAISSIARLEQLGTDR
jgi:CRP-like cAMP-binding protein